MLTVSANPTSSAFWLPPFVASFRASRPGARIRLITRSSDVLREHAATYSADLMLSEPPIDPTSIEAQRYRLRCVAALPVGHPLCEDERSEDHTSELQSLMRISFSVFCLI